MEIYGRDTASGSGGGQESTVGSARVWTGAGDRAQDAGLFDSAGLPAERAGEAAQTGAVGGRDRRHSGRRQEPTRKQRHTAKRIFDRLRAEHAFTGGYTIVKDYVRQHTLRHREMFIPLTHAPGDGTGRLRRGAGDRRWRGAEGPLLGDRPAALRRLLRQAFPAETTEAFLEGHIQAFAYFGGVPTTILYDNTKLAVARILGDGTRQKTRAFSELQSHYLFAEKFGRPAKGNDKGKVEGLVGYARRNFHGADSASERVGRS